MSDATTTTTAEASPASATTTTTTVKPGWRTSEFWLKLAAIVLSALFASDVIPTSGPASKIAAVSAFALMSLGYTVSRSIVKAAAPLLMIGWFAGHAMACGASTRQKTINATLAATSSASKSFSSYSAAHQLAIVAAAPDHRTDVAELQAWRITESEIETMFAATFQAIAAELAVDNDPNFQGMVDAAKHLGDALHVIGVSP